VRLTQSTVNPFKTTKAGHLQQRTKITKEKITGAGRMTDMWKSQKNHFSQQKIVGSSLNGTSVTTEEMLCLHNVYLSYGTTAARH